MSSADRGAGGLPAAPPSARGAGVVVTAVGMVSPVGSDARQTFTSVRAGLRRMREHPEVYACVPEHPRFDPPTPLVASAVAHLDVRPRAAGQIARWLGVLAGHALADLERRGRVAPGDGAGMALLLALPARAGLGPEARDEVLYHLHNHAERDLLPHVHLAFGGHAGALALLEQGAALVREGKVRMAAVGGVDSWLFAPWLAAADADWRILSERNVDGFQPGEAAAFVLLERGADAHRRGVRPLAAVKGFASARAAGAGAELAEALARLLPAAPPLVVCDLNGERRRAKEWACARSRLGERLGNGFALEHPASTLGDVGAATGAALAALAVQYLGTKHADRAGAVVWAASDDGERRAVALERA